MPGSRGRVVLVGAGDPTLSGAARGKSTLYPGAARISDLAAQLRRAQLPISGIVVDDSRFSGPVISPAWAPEDVPSEYGAAITALLADGGRAAPTDFIRSAQPDLAAAQWMFEVVFDYDEGHYEELNLDPTKPNAPNSIVIQSDINIFEEDYFHNPHIIVEPICIRIHVYVP